MIAGVYDRRAEWASEERPFVPSGRRPTGRPNIIFVLADDLGWGDLGCYGSLHNSTPVLDRVASQGLRMTHAYSASPTCSPTRIALYTGRYPGRLGAGLEEPIVTRDSRTGIPADNPTLPALLRAHGYATAMFGKWHCGWLPWFSPLRIGFDVFYGNLGGVLDYFSGVDQLGNHDLYEGETPIAEAGYYTEQISRRGTEYVREHARSQRPFYLQLNYTAPHWPWEGPGDESVSEKVTAAAREGRGTGLFHFEGGSLRTYHEMVKAMDAGIGTILGELDRAGVANQTIFVFTSDNGGERYAFLWPFVGQKGDLEEGGIRVPLIMRWPDALDGRQVSDVPMVTMDLTATLLDAAGADPDPNHPLDGVSLLSWLIDGREPADRDLLWRTRHQGALRRGRFKLLYDREQQPLPPYRIEMPFKAPQARLYDVTVDGREKADLGLQHPDLVAELLAEWKRFDQALLPYPRPPQRDPRGPLDEPD